jgi:hypothetical protein
LLVQDEPQPSSHHRIVVGYHDTDGFNVFTHGELSEPWPPDGLNRSMNRLATGR